MFCASYDAIRQLGFLREDRPLFFGLEHASEHFSDEGYGQTDNAIKFYDGYYAGIVALDGTLSTAGSRA